MVNSLKSHSKSAGKHKLALPQLVILSLLGALLFVVQVAFGFLPNIELVSVLIIVYTRVYGWKVFYPIYLFVVLEAVYYGINTWVIQYAYVWAILALVVLPLRRYDSRSLWVLVNTAYGFLFGAFCSITYLLIGGVSAMAAYWLSGIPFDLLHMVGNFLTALILCDPLYRLLSRLKQTVQ